VFIELAEALDCPDCQAALGLVAFVGDLQDRRVVEGHLGCPQCGVEYPIVGGAIDLRREASDSAEPGPSASAATSAHPCPPERAMQVAALLGVQERAGARLLLDEGLAACAEPVAGWGERLEILFLAPESFLPADSPGDSRPRPHEPLAGVTPMAGASGLPWPFRPRALHGIALLGGSAERLAEAERVLAPGGRLAVFDPAEDVLEAIREGGFEVHAAEALALVATRL
jgi:uncharacterized protein YbaR (Trm112 family)